MRLVVRVPVVISHLLSKVISEEKTNKLSAFGNPLLDTIVFINDTTFLQKYNLEQDGQKEVSAEVMNLLTQDIKYMEKTFTAGGCSQNMLRVFQWLTGKKHDTVIFGAVGNDNGATLLKNLLQADGVTTKYIVRDDGLPTGKTISLVHGAHRSLVAHLGAAEKITSKEIELAKVECIITKSNFVYIEAFFLTNRTDVAKHVLHSCDVLNVMVAFNISGEYVCNLVPTIVKYFAENSDIIFGNKSEFEALAKIMNLSDVKQVVDKLLRTNRAKVGKTHGNIVVITDGPNPGECYYGDGGYFLFPVMHIGEVDLKDSTGAGDAFAGGFLAGLAENKSLEMCATLGCYAAYEIIKQIGCSLPQREPDFHCT